VRKIKASRINFLKVLSHGNVADVSKAVFKRKDVAVKMIHQEDEASFQELDHEIYINSLVPPHPNVAKLLGSLTGTQRGLVMELVSQGSIEDVMQHPAEWEAVSFAERIQIALDVCHGLEWMHKRGIVHRNVSCQNVLLRQDFRAVLADFGLSLEMDENAVESITNEQTENINNIPILLSAPEALHELKYSPKTDVYMFGLFLWQLFSEQQPYLNNQLLRSCKNNDDFQPFKDAVKEGRVRPHVPADWPAELVSLITDCWNKHAELRPSMNAVEYQLTKFKEQLVELDLPTPSMPKDHEVGLEVSDDATRNGELPKMPKLPSMDVPLNIQLDRLASYLDDFETAFEAIRAYIEKEFGIHEKVNLGIKNKLGHIDTSFKKNVELMDRLEHRKVNALLQLSGRLLRLHNSGNHTFEDGRAAANEMLQELEVQSKHMPALKEAFDIARSNARKVGEELPHIKAPQKDDFDKVFRLPVKSNRYATGNSVIIPGSIQS